MNQFNLKQIAETCAEKVVTTVNGVSFFNEPFKHVVVDNFPQMILPNPY